MLRFGICNAADLRRAAGGKAPGEYFKRPCYIGLYEDAAAGPGPDTHRKVQEAILFQFMVANGAFKRTSANRFGTFDKATIDVIREVTPAGRHFAVHDVAVSDGRTAAEFHARLAAEFGDTLDFHASDLCLRVLAIRRRGARTVVVIDERGNVLQVMFEPFVLPAKLEGRRQKWLYPVNRGLRAILMRTSVSETLRLYHAGDQAVERREILLICPEAREALKRYRNFHIGTYDAFMTAPRSYAVIRVMNLLNRSYFADEALTRIIRNAAGSLEDGGVFITGSNGDAGSTVNGTIYRKQSGELWPIHKSGEGSPVDDLIRREELIPASTVPVAPHRKPKSAQAEN